MSQTLGQYLLNSTLPKGVKFSGHVTSKSIVDTLADTARHDPAAYVKSIQEIKKLGDEFATHEGVSVGLDDIQPDYARRNPILDDAMTKVRAATTDHDRRRIILEAQDALKKTVADHPGDMTLMLNSGGRGNVVQLMKTLASPVAANNSKGDVIPWLIGRSYSEGLRPAEYWIAGDEARKSVVEGKIQVTEPGEVGKLLVQNLYDTVVTSLDCGTHNGIPVSAHDTRDLLDRYLAKPAYGFPYNTLITHQVASELKKHDGEVMVRSPMTCAIHTSGVCAKCMGLSETGQSHPIGRNVGVRSSQGMAEPLTQLVLSSKHGTRTATGKETEPTGLDAIKSLLNIPKTFIHSATLANQDGTITSVTKAPQGGHFVHVNDSEHYVPPGLSLHVQAGDKVEAGDTLSDGIPRPDEVVQHKGLGFGRKYLVDRLHKAYKGSGVDIDKRHLELLTRAQLRHVQIDHDPSDEYMASEIVPLNQIRPRLEADAEEVDLAAAVGRALAHDYSYYTAGTLVTPSVVRALSPLYQKVFVSRDLIKFTPIMKSLERAPLFNPDWLARLSHRYLKQSMEEGAQYHQSSDMHGLHPMPGVMSGSIGDSGNGHY